MTIGSVSLSDSQTFSPVLITNIQCSLKRVSVLSPALSYSLNNALLTHTFRFSLKSCDHFPIALTSQMGEKSVSRTNTRTKFRITKFESAILRYTSKIYVSKVYLLLLRRLRSKKISDVFPKKFLIIKKRQ